MKKILILLLCVFILTGCATYKFQKSDSAGGQGYLVSYEGKPLPEYTVGKDSSLPDLTLAQERFKRRRSKVEYYYKKMGEIESRIKEVFWDPPAMVLDFLGSILRWPFIAVADYKYHRNPKYKERVDKLDEQKDELEKARVNALKEKLFAYIAEDLNKEPSAQNVIITAPKETKLEPVMESLPQSETLPVALEAAPKAETPISQEIIPPAVEPVSVPAIKSVPVSVVEPISVPVVTEAKENKPVVLKPEIVKAVLEPPVAIIMAKPAKGYSPLKVNFSSQKSYSKSGKIVAYDWNFGDGDTSNKKNPENTYWSTTFGSRNFIATLTVRDDAGNTSSASTVIEVITK